MKSEQVAKIYGGQYGPEAGPWNLSLQNKYLEYQITRFFEENFDVPQGAQVCNVGIGAGYWDRYLSYRPEVGGLTGIDINKCICENFAACLENEENPSPVTIVPRDVMDCGELRGRFDIVTMVGSTRMETGLFEGVLEMVFSLAKPGGSIYYQSLGTGEDNAMLESLCRKNGLEVERYALDTRHERTAHYWKIAKPM